MLNAAQSSRRGGMVDDGAGADVDEVRDAVLHVSVQNADTSTCRSRRADGARAATTWV